MKTLSDDITLTLDTSQFPEGYVTTTIYHNSIGVFIGRTYVDAQHTPVDICLNDFVMQNHGRNDYLKLNNNGELVSNELDTSTEHYTKFEVGQISRYSAALYYDGQYTSNESVYVAAAYNYPNKDIEPKIIDNDSSSEIGRIMQGSDWYVKYDDSSGRFGNLLVPHLPAKATKKFGLGLQLYNNGEAGFPFTIRPPFGVNEYSLGYAENDSNATFVTLYDLYQNTSINDADDTSIFLKYEATSGDEFGDWEEGLEWVRGRLNVSAIRIMGSDGTTIQYDETFSEGETFRVYMRRYIGTIGADWNLDKIMAGDREVYNTGWKGVYEEVTNDLAVYKDNYGTIEVGRSSQQELQYAHLYAEPIYEEIIDDRLDPDEYIGKCTIAVLDSCYSRYYLAWMDRFGDVMSQPFAGKMEYTEDFERNEIKDYKLRRRVIHNEVQPKWRLNTKWLNEDIYPMYESIFTSPYLLLYDTETDRSWNVILSDSEYKEKTFNTEKTLFNLEINVEANTKQNYIF